MRLTVCDVQSKNEKKIKNRQKCNRLYMCKSNSKGVDKTAFINNCVGFNNIFPLL